MIRIQSEDFDPGVELERLRESCDGKAGAIVCMMGLVRDLNDGENIQAMTLEHYPGMAEKALTAIEQEANSRWALNACVIIHRVGALKLNDHIVFVAAASVHRKDAFEACEYMIDTLKTDVPFWKKETTSDGERWVGNK